MKKGMLKRITLFILIGVLSISVVGCGAKKKESEEALDKIKDNGKVIVGLSADYAPYEFHAMIEGEDKIVGFDVDLAREVAKDMGVNLEIKEMEFDPLIGALKAGQIDMIISGMNPDEERKKQIDFSDIYYQSKHAVLVKSGDRDKYKKVEDLNAKKIGVQIGSTQEKIAQEKIKGSELKQLANVNSLVLELKTGKVDALITEEPVANMVIKSNPELALSDILFTDEGGGNAIGIRKNSPKLLESINKTVKRLQDSGELDKFIINANDLAAKNQSNS